MYRVGIIGCGGIAQVHAAVLRDLDHVELTACADIRAERAAKMGEEFSCAAYASMQDMMSHHQLDAVHLCTPHYLHPDMAAYAAERGIAVFTEKPPAIDETGWRRVLEAAGKVPVGICFQNRCNANVLKLREMMDRGALGSLLGIRAFVTWNRSAAYYQAADWKGKWASEGGGALINQAIHTLDLVVRFLGKPDEIESTLRNHHLKGIIEVEDTAEIWMRKGNSTALIYASTAYCADAPVLIELQFERAAARLEQDTLTLISDSGSETIPCKMDMSLGRSYWGAGHKSCIAEFYRCMETGDPYFNRPEACEDTMRALFTIYEQNRC